ncbi:MAG: aconitase X swivel domain-containing protein [Rhodospirillales bacterium]
MTGGRVIRGHVGIGPRVTGMALAADDYFSARYDLDRVAGVFSWLSHALYGQSYVGKVLVLHGAKGGVATAWMLRAMAADGKAPLALLLNIANPIMVQGAAFADLAFMDRFQVDITQAIRTGEIVTVDPEQGQVTVHDAA